MRYLLTLLSVFHLLCAGFILGAVVTAENATPLDWLLIVGFVVVAILGLVKSHEKL